MKRVIVWDRAGIRFKFWRFALMRSTDSHGRLRLVWMDYR